MVNMKVDVLNMEGKKVSTADLSVQIYEAPIRVDLMHQAYVRQIANARLGGGRKPWRQKGTGRARQGSIRAAQWVGGGKIHTPRPRDYSQKMPRKMRRAALRSALSVKAAEEGIIVIDELMIEEPKTKLISASLDKLVGDASVLILIPEKNENSDLVHQSIRNLPRTKMLIANYLNVRDLLGYDKVLIPVAALDVIESYLG
jgi:large subunit ribosomal protein L4